VEQAIEEIVRSIESREQVMTAPIGSPEAAETAETA